MPEYKAIANTTDIPVGESRILEVEGNSIAIWNINGNYYAYQNLCPHRGGPVGEGEMEGSVVTCPWHGWTFDVTTGVSPVNPAAKLTRYDVKVEGNQIKINI